VKNLALLLVTTAALTATAQTPVGHLPATSPYRDLEYAQEFTIVAGSFRAHRDPANVGPQGGTLIGAHYEWRAGGPAHLIGDISRISSDRRLINPAVRAPGRDLGTVSRPLYSANVGLGMSLTGAKSWHGVVPEVAGGVGMISDFRSQTDSGGFKFGTRFAITWGGGVRWVPGGKWQVRADIMSRAYTIAYPDAFYVAPTGGTAVVGAAQAKSFWTNNPAFTLGLSRLF
jgi:hypothetical protein